MVRRHLVRRTCLRSYRLLEEDMPMIEAQQRLLGQRDSMDAHPVLLPNDTASARARRRIQGMLSAE